MDQVVQPSGGGRDRAEMHLKNDPVIQGHEVKMESMCVCVRAKSTLDKEELGLGTVFCACSAVGSLHPDLFVCEGI